MKPNRPTHLARIVKYIQVILFVSGMCILQMLQFIVTSQAPFDIATLLILFSVILQILYLYITGDLGNIFWKLKEQYLIPFTLTGICMFLNYQYISVAPQEIYKADIGVIVVGMIRFPLQTVAYGLTTYSEPKRTQLNLYLITIVYWLCSNTYQTVQLIKKFTGQSNPTYITMQKDIGICLLGTITTNAIIMMHIALRQKPKIKQNNQQELQLALKSL